MNPGLAVAVALLIFAVIVVALSVWLDDQHHKELAGVKAERDEASARCVVLEEQIEAATAEAERLTDLLRADVADLSLQAWAVSQRVGQLSLTDDAGALADRAGGHAA